MTATIQTIETPKRWRAQDTSGNNNHGQIYSGRGLEFDGVSDSLTGPNSTTIMSFVSKTGTWTSAWWMKVDTLQDSTIWASRVDSDDRNTVSLGSGGR